MRDAGRLPMLSPAISAIGVGRAEIGDEVRRFVDQRAVGRVGVLRQRVQRAVISGSAILEPFAVDEARLERGRDERLQVAPAEIGIGIFAGDDLALLGDAETTADAACRLREDRVEARPAAAADGAAAAVEEAQLDAVVAKRVDERELRPIERPVGGQVPAVLVAVGIAEHHLLPAVAALEPAAVEGERERVAHDRRRALEIVDGLEQRNDVDRERLAAQQADFLQQDRDFEQVGDRLAFRDHVIRQRRGAVAAMDVRRNLEHRQLGTRQVGIREMRRMQETRASKLALQHREPLTLGKPGVVGRDAGIGEELGDQRLVHVRVLPQVEHREVKAEHLDRADQGREPPGGKRCRAMQRERGVDGAQVREKLVRIRIRRQTGMRRARRDMARQRGGGRGDAGVDADQRLAIRLVVSMRIGVARGRGERQELGRGRDQTRGERKLRAEPVDLVEIVGEGDRGLPVDRVGERRAVDEGIAVAVAADPRAQAQERRQRDVVLEAELRADLRGERQIELRHFGEKRVAVIREAVLDLVFDLELDEADHRRLPQREHLPVESRLEFHRFVRRQRHAVAPLQEPRDLAFAIEDALALDFGRVRRQHGAHQRVGEPCLDPRAVDAFLRDAIERVRDAAPLRR